VPAPRITTQRTAGSFSNFALCSISRSRISIDSALSDSGRLSVIQPMPSLTSARTCGADMGQFPQAFIGQRPKVSPSRGAVRKE